MMHVFSMSLSIHPSFSDGVLIKIIKHPCPSLPLLRNHCIFSLDVIFFNANKHCLRYFPCQVNGCVSPSIIFPLIFQIFLNSKFFQNAF